MMQNNHTGAPMASCRENVQDHRRSAPKVKQTPLSKKTSKSRKDTAVQGTNDSSVVSKCSTVRFGYFKDDYLEKFVRKPTRRAPLIHRGYFIRAKAVDFILREFLKKNGGKSTQIVSLGAGFDSAFFRLKSEGLLTTTVFIELDFPELVRRKSALIGQDKDLSCLVGCHNAHSSNTEVVLNTADYKLIGIDITNTSKVEELLFSCDIKGDNPTLFLSECVLTYIKDNRVTEILRWTNKKFSQSTFVLYEQINPFDAFGNVMTSHFNKIGSPLQCIEKYPSLQSQILRFKNAGWVHCEAMDMNEFYNGLLSVEERQRIETLEPFDEYEEWHLKCSHYIIVCAHSNHSERFLMMKECSHVPSTDAETIKDAVMPRMTEAIKDEEKSVILCDKNSSSLPAVDINDDSSTTLDELISGTKSRPLTYDDGYNESRHSNAKDSMATLDHRETIQPELDKSKTLYNCVSGNYCFHNNGTKNASSFISIKRVKCSNPIQRFAHSSVLFKDQILTLGGFGCHGNKHCRLGDCVATLCDTSSTLLNKSLLTDSCQIDRLHPMMFSITAEKELWVFGGRRSPMNPDPNILRIKLHQDFNRCHPQHLGDLQEESPNSQLKIDVVGVMSPARWRHTVNLYQNEGCNEAYIFGGKTEKSPVLGDCQVYKMGTNSLHLLPVSGSIPERRHSHAAVIWDNHLVVCGGLNQELQPLNDIVLLNLKTKKWTTLKVKGNLLPRYSHRCHVNGDKLIVVGGVNLNHTPPGLALIHLGTGDCQEYFLPTKFEEDVIMYHNFSSVLTNDGTELIVIGGGGNCFSFGSHFNSTPIVLQIEHCLRDFLNG